MIYVDGASFTYGDELSDPSTQSWPACLSKILDKEIVNNAKVGKSNEHMIFDTVNFCLAHQPKFVIVAFGPVSRKFFVRRENNFLIDIAVSSSNSVYQEHKELQQFQNLLFKYWSNYLYDCWKFLQSIVCLESFLKQQNIQYLLLNTVSQQSLIDLLTISTQTAVLKDRLLDAFAEMNDNQIVTVEKQLQNLYNNIDHKNFYDFAWHFKKLVDFKSHPSAEQHQEIAKFVSTLVNYDSI
jgi:hypothetical protein